MKVVFTVECRSFLEAGVLEEMLNKNKIKYTSTIPNGADHTPPPAKTKYKKHAITPEVKRVVINHKKNYPTDTHEDILAKLNLPISKSAVSRILLEAGYRSRPSREAAQK